MEGEILNGCPVSRCIGDYRFKCNPNFELGKQPVLPLPEVKCCDAWRAMDFVIVGSSGFWDMQRNQSKGTIEKINLMIQKKA